MSGAKNTSKYRENKQTSMKDNNTLDNKHRLMVKHFTQVRSNKTDIIDQIKNGPSEYKEIIENHFRIKKNDILSTCKKWVDESVKFKTKMNDIYKVLEETLNTL